MLESQSRVLIDVRLGQVDRWIVEQNLEGLMAVCNGDIIDDVGERGGTI